MGVCIMANKKQFYTLDQAKRIIIIDKSVEPTDKDIKMVQMYGIMGFTPHEKIQRTAGKNNKQLTDKDIKTALANKPKELAEYERIKNIKAKEGGGFFNARNYAKDVIAKGK